MNQWVKNNFESDYHIWGVEPTVNRALAYAVAEGYIALIEDSYSMTPEGVIFAKIILRKKDLFVEEKIFLIEIGKNGISEQRVKELTSKFL